MEDLWGDDQPSAGRTALRVRVSQLRKALPGDAELLVTRRSGYALQLELDALELWRFERHLAEGERALASDPERALRSLTAALDEWRGRPLDDLAHAPWAQAPVVRLEGLRAAALELRVEVREGRDGRDASRMLASASLALQRGLGIEAETQLAPAGAAGMLQHPGAAIVVGLSQRWMSEGLGKARLQLVRQAPCLVLLVRRGLRPGGLAPPEAFTRFAWSGGG